jgi:hypothetical protein
VKIFLIATLLAQVMSPASRAGEWINLFDGQSLAGWRQLIEPARPDTRSAEEKRTKPVPAHLRPEEDRGKATFRVEDGAIVGRAEHYCMHSYLVTEREFGNFELEFEVHYGWPATKTRGCNSGIQIRSSWQPDKATHRMNGLQVDIDTHPGFAGAFFLEGELRGRFGKELPVIKYGDPAGHRHFQEGQWNRMRLLATGARIQTWVNGEPVGDIELPGLYAAQPKGFIGLQVHEILDPGPCEIRWRNVRLRELHQKQNQ